MISLAPEIKVSTRSTDNVIASGMFSEGKYVGVLESKIRGITGSKHAIATSSGSSADLVCMLAMKALHPDKNDVIVPSLTFIAQVNSILMAGLNPVYVDCYPETMQMRLDFIESLITPNTLCLFGVHLLGKFSPVFDFDFGVPTIEDGCEGFCGVRGGKHFGTFGLAGTFSFYPSHVVGCGEGGMIVTDDDEFSGLCRQIKNHGRMSNRSLERFKFPVQGTNAKMPELSAAIACEQVDQAEAFASQRRSNCKTLSDMIGSDWSAESPHAYPVFCETKQQRDSAVEELTSMGIECRCMFECIPTDGWCKSHERGSFPHAEILSDTVLYVPVHQGLSYQQLIEISDGIKKTTDS